MIAVTLPRPSAIMWAAAPRFLICSQGPASFSTHENESAAT